MENMEVLVREMVMQSSANAGMALGMGFQGLEWAWVAIVATIVIAFVSAKRVSIVSVGWTWGAKPGQVRVRVHSFSSLRDGSIVATSGMFSAEIVNCSADSCSEDASSLDHLGGVASETGPIASKVAAEVMFIFEKKHPVLLSPPPPPHRHSHNHHRALPRDTIPRKRAKSQNLYIEFASLPSPTPSSKTAPKPVGFSDLDSSQLAIAAPALPTWAQSLLAPSPHHTERPSAAHSAHPCAAAPAPPYDPLWRLRVHDAVVRALARDAGRFRAPEPVCLPGSGVATTVKGDVVRVWESGTRALRRTLSLPRGYGDGGAVSAFDVDWEAGRGVVAVGRRGGELGVGSLEAAALESEWYHDAATVECVSLDRSAPGKTLFAGGRAAHNPGCAVSLWDSRSRACQLSLPLASAPCVFGIRAQAHELYVRDGRSSVAAHDVRMLAPPGLHRLACPEPAAAAAAAPQDRWWDMDTAPLDDDDAQSDVEDEFWDCAAVDDAKAGARGGAGYVGSLVMAIGRNFSKSAQQT